MGEYISKATPVGSESIARNYPLGVSPATIRLEMAKLEEEGFITRPHYSAGGVPSDKGYRYYVEYLEEMTDLSLNEKLLSGHLFSQVAKEVEEWLRVGASILCQLTRNAAVVTKPRAFKSCFKHLELISIHKFMALLIILLKEAKLKQRFLVFDYPISQEELSATTEKLNEAFAGLSSAQIKKHRLPLSPLEEKVTYHLLQLIEGEEQAEEEPVLYGLHYVLNQPEFGHRHKALKLMEAIEGKKWLKAIEPQGEGIKVIIGEENEEEGIRDCSLVLSRYGIPQEIEGTIGVLGPTRMHYGRAMSAVKYVSEVLSGLMNQIYS